MKTNRKTTQRETLKKVLKYMGHYRIYLIISLILAAVTVGLTLYVPKLTGYAVDAIIGPGNVDFARVKHILLKIVICIAVTSLSQWVMNMCNNRMTFHIVRDIRDEAIAKIEVLPLRYIDGHSYGEVVSRVIADVDQFSDGLLMGFTQLFTGIATIIGTFCFMLSVNKVITCVVVLITPVSFFVAGFIAKRTYSMFRLQSETRGEQTGLVEEMVGNQKVVQAFGKGADVAGKFDEINARLADASLKATFYSSITNPSTRFVNSLVYTGVGIVGAFSVIRGTLSVGQLSCFLSYANRYTKPFNEISGVITELQNAIACADRIFELIEEEAQTPDPEGAASVTDQCGNIEWEDVSFSYVPEQKLIEHMTLSVKKGQKIAIVGPTGCGKTTLINLLMRFYDVNGGRILLEGSDIREMSRADLRARFGMVLQETWLRTGTILDNIRMGNESATRDRVIAAAKACHAHSFIMRLPDGYDTWITEDGGSLSQGQKQLLCIARVMLISPPMLILDEATSSIDTRTELIIQEAFAKLMQGRTSFIVAHRLSTIREADCILVMKDGHIIEHGTHEELLAERGFYHDLYQSQFCHSAV